MFLPNLILRSAYCAVIFFTYNCCFSMAITEVDFSPIKYSLPFPPVLVPNNRLLSAQKILLGQLNGPEALLLEDGGRTIYTGTGDGKLLKIVDGQIVASMPINGNYNGTCGTYETVPICGYPHGIRRLSTEELVVVDSYLGLYKFTFNNGGKVTQLMGSTNFDNKGTDCLLFNSLDVVNNGSTLLISCSSVRWDNRRAIHDFMEGRPNGRLIEYNVPSGKATIVLGNLNFANGVKAHPDEQSVVVSELTRARIVRYYYAGPKKGKSEMFAENLPGLPDNIQLSADGKSFFIGMDQVRHAEDLSMVDKLGPFPALRQTAILFIPEANLRTFYGNNLLKKQGLVLELDLEGNIINNWQDPSGVVIGGISETSDNGTHLFLGSGSFNYIAILAKQ